MPTDPLDDRRLEIRLLCSREGFAEAGKRIEGRYLLTATHVFTAVSLAAAATPQSKKIAAE